MKRMVFLMLGLCTCVAAQSVPVALLPAQSADILTPEKAQAAAKPSAGAIPAHTNNAWPGYLGVQKTAENGNPQEALHQLNMRLNNQPEDSKAAYLKGLVLMQLGESEKAERWFKMMQANFPDLPQADNALAVIYSARGDFPAAEAVLRAVLKKQPGHISARINLAKVYLQLAQAEYEKALKAKPDDAMIARQLKTLKTIQ